MVNPLIFFRLFQRLTVSATLVRPTIYAQAVWRRKQSTTVKGNELYVFRVTRGVSEVQTEKLNKPVCCPSEIWFPCKPSQFVEEVWVIMFLCMYVGMYVWTTKQFIYTRIFFILFDAWQIYGEKSVQKTPPYSKACFWRCFCIFIYLFICFCWIFLERHHHKTR